MFILNFIKWKKTLIIFTNLCFNFRIHEKINESGPLLMKKRICYGLVSYLVLIAWMRVNIDRAYVENLMQMTTVLPKLLTKIDLPMVKFYNSVLDNSFRYSGNELDDKIIRMSVYRSTVAGELLGKNQ